MPWKRRTIPGAATSPPADLEDGVYTVFIDIDFNDRVTELDESNNTVALGQIYVGARMNLASPFKPFFISPSATTGTSTSIRFGLKNTGNLTCFSGLTQIYLTPKTAGLLEEPVLVGEYLAPQLLDGGESLTVNDMIDVPEHLPSGDYQLRLIYDATDQVVEYREGDNDVTSEDILAITNPSETFAPDVLYFNQLEELDLGRLLFTARAGFSYTIQGNGGLDANGWRPLHDPMPGRNGILATYFDLDGDLTRLFIRVLQAPE